MLLSCISMQASMSRQLVLMVSSYAEVQASGDVPDGLIVSYLQQQDKHYTGRLLAGESATLQLDGLPAGTLTRVELMMHSNASAGAGSLTMTLNGQTVWQIADNNFKSNAWHGSYTNAFVPITHTFSNPILGPIALTIRASVNSLYLQKITLYYEEMEPIAATVSFDTHAGTTIAPLTEQEAGMGVVLPGLSAPVEGWRFVGWKEQALVQTRLTPTTLTPGMRYYPTSDITLHAVYANWTEDNLWLHTDTQRLEGNYAIAYPGMQLLLTSAWQDNEISATTCGIETTTTGWRLPETDVPASAHYHIVFADNGMQLTHISSGKAVGFTIKSNTPTPSHIASTWHEAAGANGSFMLYTNATNEGYIYALRPKGTTGALAFALRLTAFTSSDMGFVLIPLSEPKERIYTSFILGDNVPTLTREATVGGCYDLMGRPVRQDRLPQGQVVISNGKKQLYIHK